NEVRIVASGEEGLRAAASFKPHIVLCDIGLPGMNGFELLKPLREALRGEHSIFAAVTAQGRHEDEARALAVGYDSFLLKPLQPGSLVRLLRSYANGPH
ncbi:MAG TPA: response regulator, partial [Usitatibacter sp.]|nr:response regulator [Usitatibacter sp.]